MNTSTDPMPAQDEEGPSFDFTALLAVLRRYWLALLAAGFVGGAAGYGASFLIKPTFLSATLLLPPQQQQGAAAAALSQLGALSNLAGGAANLRSSADQFVALMQSVTISDRIITKFNLVEEYGSKFKQDARKVLSKRVQFTIGKKDGLISIEVEDTDPSRAAAMANQYVDELRAMLAKLALTEAQQRRVFFEQRLEESKAKLVAAQSALEGSGYGAGALKAEPRTAADGYAKLRADLTAARVRLQVMRGTRTETSPEVVNQMNAVRALTEQVAALEASQAGDSGPDYVGKYREFKYQETLFDLFAKQYELARIDESREGALIQVVDPGVPAERKHSPSRGRFALIAALASMVLLFGWSWYRQRQVAQAGT